MQGLGRLATGLLGAARRRSPRDVLEAASSQVIISGQIGKAQQTAPGTPPLALLLLTPLTPSAGRLFATFFVHLYSVAQFDVEHSL